MDVSSLASAMAGAQMGASQLAMAAKMMKMNADSAASIIQVIEAAQQNIAVPASCRVGAESRHHGLIGCRDEGRLMSDIQGLRAQLRDSRAVSTPRATVKGNGGLLFWIIVAIARRDCVRGRAARAALLSRRSARLRSRRFRRRRSALHPPRPRRRNNGSKRRCRLRRRSPRQRSRWLPRRRSRLRSSRATRTRPRGCGPHRRRGVRAAIAVGAHGRPAAAACPAQRIRQAGIG